MRYYLGMIKEFADKITATIFAGRLTKGIDAAIQRKARLKLQQIDAAVLLDDLRNPPSNRLERKKGKMKHLHCIWVNKQWRVCFRWDEGDAYQVRFTDYH